MTSPERAFETPVFRKLGGFKLNGLGPTAMPVCRCSLGALRRVSVTFGIRTVRNLLLARRRKCILS